MIEGKRSGKWDKSRNGQLLSSLTGRLNFSQKAQNGAENFLQCPAMKNSV